MNRLVVACVLLLGCFVGATQPATGQAIRGDEATEADGARFTNERAKQHMLELEQRMFRLAEMLKESQPEDAQRLVMGVERSREKLLVQRMSSVSELIGGLELSAASGKIDEVIGELQAIKKLLLTPDLDAAIKQEQLRKIKEAIKDLDRIAEQEAENQAQSDKLAESGEPSDAAMKGVAGAESRNQEATDRLSDKVGDINPQDPNLGEAQQALEGASGKMGEASGQLGEQSSPSGASESQGEARKKLDEAKKNWVLVALDFPRDEEIKAKVPNPERNKELQAKYGVRGFPTILLMTADGEVFGRTGYQAGGPEKYLEHMAELRAGRQQIADIEVDDDFAAVRNEHARDAVATRIERFG
ncbi:MAG: hypothetical protein ACPGYV_07840, partial [Phycisphaeraceae bacterium]